MNNYWRNQARLVRAPGRGKVHAVGPLGFTTKCPRIGAAQWSCKFAECICHLKGDMVAKGKQHEHA
jgi:hypothetical protein